ncbi:MAG: LamG domain-containing protein [Candidatus Aenigmarchaeota archaeon]|nr:LamG domain-containing protein [Candidatus Aenigmarchaeota archaeon]
MVLNMPFDTNVSSTTTGAVKDYSGYKNNGTLKNFDFDADSGWISDGKIGGAYEFDGNDYVDCGNDPSLNITGEITLEAWVKLSDENNNRPIISKSNDGLYENYLLSVTSSNSFVFATSDDSKFTSNAQGGTAQKDVWYHVVGTLNETHAYLYVNGMENGSDSTVDSPGFSDYDVIIGKRELGQYFNGTIDEVRVYNSSLSAAQVYQRWLETKDGHSDKATIVSNETDKSEDWMCEVTPNDGYEDGNTLNSSVLTIINYFPSVTYTATSPSSVYTNTSINLNATCADDDPDDTLTVYYQTYLNGAKDETEGSKVVSNGTNTIVYTYGDGNFSKGDDIVFEVWCGDGYDNSSKTNTSTITVLNIKPVTETSRIEPAPTAYANESLTGYCNATDLDGDDVAYYWRWYKDGGLNSGGSYNHNFETIDSRSICSTCGSNNYVKRIGDNHALAIFYKNGGRAVIIGWDDSKDNLVNVSEYQFETSSAYDLGIDVIDSSHALITFSRGSSCRAKILKWNSTYGDLKETSSVDFHSGTCSATAVTVIGPNHALAAHEDAGWAGWFAMLEWNSTFGDLKKIDSFNFDGRAGGISLDTIDSSHAIVTYSSFDQVGYSKIITWNSTFQNVNDINTMVLDPVMCASTSVKLIDSNHAVVAYGGPDSAHDGRDGWAKILKWNSTYGNLQNISSMEYEPNSVLYVNADLTDSNHLIIVYEGPNTDGWAAVVEWNSTFGDFMLSDNHEYSTDGSRTGVAAIDQSHALIFYRQGSGDVARTVHFLKVYSPQGTEQSISVLDYSQTTKGEYWNFSCLANDGTENSSWLNSTDTLIINSIPYSTSNSISPSPIYTNTNANLSVTCIDNDIGDTITVYVQPYLNGVKDETEKGQVVNNGASTKSYTYGSGNFSKNDNITFEFWCSDGVSNSTKYNSSTVMVQNTPPTLPTQSLPEHMSVTNLNYTVLTCSGSADIDGDPINYFYFGDTSSGSAPLGFNDTGTGYNWTDLSRGQRYYWKCMASDGYDNSTNTTVWYFNVNEFPVMDNSIIDPSPFAYTNETLDGYCNASDSDGTITNFYWRWYVDDQLNQSGEEDVEINMLKNYLFETISSVSRVSIDIIDSSHAIVVYSTSAGSFVKILEWDNNYSNVWNASTYKFYNYDSYDTSVAVIDSTHAIIGYSEGWECNMEMLEWNSTFGDIQSVDFQYVNIFCGHIMIKKIDDRHAVVSSIYNDDAPNDYGYVETYVWNDSFQNITEIDSWSSGNHGEPVIDLIDSNHAIIAYTGSGYDGYASIMSWNSTFEDVKKESTYEFDPDSTTIRISVNAIDSTHAIVTYWRSADNGWMKLLEWNSTFGNLGETDSYHIDPSYYYYPSGEIIDQNHAIIVHKGGSSMGYANILEWNSTFGNLENKTTYNFDSYADYNFIKLIDSKHALIGYRGPDGRGWMKILLVPDSYYHEGDEFFVGNISYLDTSKNHNWTLSCMASDGYKNTSWMNSTDTRIINYVPLITSNITAPSDVYTDTDVYLNVTCHDIDPEDSLTVYVQPYLNGGKDETEKATGVTFDANTLVYTYGSGNFSKGDSVVFEFWCGDNDDNSSKFNTTQITVLNTAPYITDNSTMPADVYTDTNVYLNVTCSDLDADTLRVYTQTYLNGGKDEPEGMTIVSNNTNNIVYTYTSGNFLKNDEIIFEFWCGDGDANTSKYNTSSITVLNRVPVITANATSPSNVYTNTDVYLNVTCIDADLGETLRVYTQPYLNGGKEENEGSHIVSNDTNTMVYTYLSGNFSKTNTIIFEFWCGDGDVNTTKYNTTQITVLNTPPVTESSRIDPSPFAYTNETLLGYCNSSDIDGDDVSYYWRWYRDDVLNLSGLSFAEGVSNGVEMNVANRSYFVTTKYQNWTLSCLANDGASNSSWLNSTNTRIINYVPLITSNITAPSDVYTDTDVYLNVTCHDIDPEDSLTVYVQPYLNGGKDETEKGTGVEFDANTLVYTYGSGNFSKGDEIVFEVWCGDNDVNSSKFNTTQITVLNTPPYITDNSTMPANVYTGTDIELNVTCSDIDTADTLRIYTQPYLNGGKDEPVGSYIVQNGVSSLSYVYGSGNFSKGDNVVLEFWCGDGDDNTTRYNTTMMTVLNSVPLITANATWPSNIHTNIDTNFNATCSDADSGDTITVYSQVYLNGGKDENEAAKVVANGVNSLIYTYGSGNYSTNDTIIFEFWCGDGDANTSKYNSSEITVQNTAPNITSVVHVIDPIRGGGMQTINPSGQDDIDLNDLYLYCCNDTDNTCVPSAGNDVCNDGTFAYDYSGMYCNYNVPYINGDQFVRCRTYDGEEYSLTTASTSFVIDSAIPVVSYVSPTPGHNSRQIANSVTINVSVSDAFGSVDGCTLEWGGTNYSMTMRGSGGSVTCDRVMSTSSGQDYAFRVYAQDIAGNIGKEAQRSFRENYEPVISNIIVTPLEAYPRDDLYCNVSGIIDNDGDPFNIYFEWYDNDSQLVFTENNTLLYSVLKYGNTTKKETWTCVARAYDGYENGTQVSDNVFILSPAPIAHVIKTLTSMNMTQAVFSMRRVMKIWVYLTDEDGKDDIGGILVNITDPTNITKVQDAMLHKINPPTGWLEEEFDGPVPDGYLYEYVYTIPMGSVWGTWNVSLVNYDIDYSKSYNTTTFAVSTISFQVRLVLNDMSSKIDIPGIDSGDINTMPTGYHPSPDHFFVSSESGNAMTGLVFFNEYPRNVIFERTVNDFTMGIDQNLPFSGIMLVFTEGGNEAISKRMDIIERGTFMDNMEPSFSYGLGEKHEIKVSLYQNEVDMIANTTVMGSGSYMIEMTHQGLVNGKPGITVKKI